MWYTVIAAAGGCKSAIAYASLNRALARQGMQYAVCGTRYAICNMRYRLCVTSIVAANSTDQAPPRFLAMKERVFSIPLKFFFFGSWRKGCGGASGAAAHEKEETEEAGEVRT
jgi:hypothetical protein